MHIFSIITNLRFQDVVDVLFLTMVAYYLYLWFRGTKAFKALVGLLILGSIYTIASLWGLFLTTWVFQILWQVLIILIIILFQSEIRQVLERVNPIQNIILRKSTKPEEWIPGFADAVSKMAKRKIGALIIVERSDRVDEHITEGQRLEGMPTPEILLSIFQKDSPLHDGAVLIRRGRIRQVACYLPLSSAEKLPKEWGTRHRAALGLSERCDACVVVISEERGDISIVREGRLIHADEMTEFSKVMGEAIQPVSPITKTRTEKIHSLLSNRWQAKFGSLALVCFLWLLFAGQQDFRVSFSVYLNLKNTPSNLEIINPINPKLEITVEGLRKDASTLSEKNVSVDIDLYHVGPGKSVFTVSRDMISLPTDRVHVIKIEPNQVEFQFREKTVNEPQKNAQ